MINNKSFERRMNYLKGLKKGWYDDNQGEPLSLDLINKVRDLLINLNNNHQIDLPHLYPTIKGEIQAEWSLDNWELSLIFVNLDKIKTYATQIQGSKSKDLTLKWENDKIEKDLALLFSDLSQVKVNYSFGVASISKESALARSKKILSNALKGILKRN